MKEAEVDKPENELIKLFVTSQTDGNGFHEVTAKQLDEYIEECKDHKIIPKRNRYHQLAIMAKVDTNTSDNEFDRLLENDIRTLVIQTRFNRPQDVDLIFLKVNTAIDKFYMLHSFRTPIGIAVEINGEQLTTGRMRNNDKFYVEVGHIIVLTTNEDYKFCCFKEIVYLDNLWRYLEVMKIGDVVHIGYNQIIGKVVKCRNQSPLTVEVIKAGYLSSYMNVKIPYYIPTRELTSRDKAEADIAVENGAHFLIIAGLKDPTFLHTLKAHVGESIRLIGSFNFECLEEKFLDIADHILHLDAIWIEDMFHSNLQRQIMNAISQCNSSKTTTIGTLPLETCSDFNKFENHDRVKQIDCLLIQKSSRRQQFPLIVKKLLPVVENKTADVLSLENLSCADAVVNFVLRTISSIPCRGIVMSNCCPKAAMAFAIPQIYCPVVCVVKDDFTARLLNLRRNLKTIVCDNSSMSSEIGISFGRQQGIFNTGDFLISIAESMNEASEVCLNVRVFYLPPLSASITQSENE